MRILYLIKSFDYGGAENHVLDLANSMAGSGNEVFLISEKGHLCEFLDKKVTFIRMRLTDWLLPFQIAIICFIAARNRIDILHAHKRLAILQASITGKIIRLPVVATIHGRTRHDLRSWISRRMTGRFIFVSGKTIDSNRHLELFKDKSVLIHNGVRIPGSFGSYDPASLLYVCRIDRKHYEVISMIINKVLPSLAVKNPSLTFNVAGDGKYIGILRKEAEILNQSHGREICRFLGYIPDVKPVLQGSGLVMGVGRVALEALSCSVPVISLNRLFLGQIISRDNYEFYQYNNFVAVTHDKPDPERLTGLLSRYLDDPAYWHDEAAILQKTVEMNLGMEKIAAEIKTLYETLVDNMNNPSREDKLPLEDNN
jgi:L-malate glycosyltransferase